MTVEARLQSQIRRECKAMGFDVLVIKAGPGIPDGWEDIMIFGGIFWGTIETKKSPDAPYRPLQKERIEKHNDWSWGRRVDPTNWANIRIELEMIAHDYIQLRRRTRD